MRCIVTFYKVITQPLSTRCVHITDIGIGYISTMLALHTLYLRWCTQIRDFGLQHICGMRSMQILSLAGTFSAKIHAKVTQP